MKRVLMSLLLLTFIGSNVSIAQGRGERKGDDRKARKEHMEARKIAMITEALDLSSEEAQKFWPVYNAFNKEMEAIHDKRRADRMKMKESMEKQEELTDAQIEAQIQNRFETEQEMLDVRVRYHDKFKKVLTMQQLGKLYMTEERFKQMLLKEMQERSKSGKGGGDGRHGPSKGYGHSDNY